MRDFLFVNDLVIAEKSAVGTKQKLDERFDFLVEFAVFQYLEVLLCEQKFQFGGFVVVVGVADYAGLFNQFDGMIDFKGVVFVLVGEGRDV